ncbi:hypothetical protein [Aeromicrobium sp. 179-A 4D2 NHS]|uniref:hypothetical protein n=1 Tax=Aeromicrobium sp. 179-A 4D2 NHS TaxID=3142375 RepID=UPI00399FB2A0
MQHPMTYNVMRDGLPYLVVASRDKALHVAEYVGEREVSRAHGGDAVNVLQERVTGMHWSKKAEPADDQPRAIIFADHAAITTAARTLADFALVKNASNKFFAVARRLTFRASQPVGYRFVILPDALAERFHAPVDMNLRSVEAWADAFGVKANSDGLATMARLVSEGNPVDIKIANAFDQKERNALSQSSYSSIKTQCNCLESAAKAIDLADTIRGLDPMLTEYNDLSGLTTTVTYTGHGSRFPRFNIVGNCNFKEGESLWLTNTHGSKFAFRVQRLFLESDRLVAELEPTSSSYADVRDWEDVRPEYGSRLVALSSPFLFARKKDVTRNWSPYEKQEPVPGRAMPVSVALAGARRG